MNNVLDQLSNLTVSERLAVADLLNRLELEHSQTILQVMLYGSGARGERGAGSDVDLLIVTRHDDWRRQESIRLLAAHLSNAYDVTG
jgi:predicted nucleotidyltransferase